MEKYMLTHPPIEKAWAVAGTGHPKGLPPFKVGFRLFHINHDGTFSCLARCDAATSHELRRSPSPPSSLVSHRIVL